MNTINVTKNGLLTLHTANTFCQEDILIDIQTPMVETETRHLYYLNNISDNTTDFNLDIDFISYGQHYNGISMTITNSQNNSTQGDIYFYNNNGNKTLVATYNYTFVVGTTSWKDARYRHILTTQKSAELSNSAFQPTFLLSIDVVKQ